MVREGFRTGPHTNEAVFSAQKGLKQNIILEEKIMAYDVEKFTKLGAMKELAQRVKAGLDASENKIEKIKVNGVELTIGADKSVDITVPNGGGTTAHFEVADTVPAADAAQDGVLYLVKNESSGTYDIYVKAGEKMVKTGNTSVDLSGYVQKEDGKGLSSNDYTNEEKAKLAAIDFATEAEVTEMLNEVFGA